MATTRRQFIKQSAGAVSVSLMMPRLLFARPQEPAAVNPNRRILLIIQQAGANDGLNTVVPYTDSRYYALRPVLAWKDSELKDAQGNSTIINSQFGFHPSLTELKGLFDAGKVAAVLGVGYPNPNLSHFTSTDIWMTANPQGAGTGLGWLGKYADLALVNKPGLNAASIGSSLPKAFFANKEVIPNITPAGGNDPFSNYTYQTDARYAGDRNNQLNAFNANSGRDFPAGSFLFEIADTSLDAVQGASQLQNSVKTYTSTVTYPAGNPLSTALKMAAETAITIDGADIFWVSIGGWDTHSSQIGNAQSPTDKIIGQQANLLKYVSEGIKAFYDDMAAHGLGDNTLIMTWSEFGRRPNENASHGTDHGTASVQFIVGNQVKGGLYGAQPSLEATNLDSAGNMRFTTDFRAVYATILDKWLVSGDSRAVLGGTFANLGFL